MQKKLSFRYNLKNNSLKGLQSDKLSGEGQFFQI